MASISLPSVCPSAALSFQDKCKVLLEKVFFQLKDFKEQHR